MAATLNSSTAARLRDLVDMLGNINAEIKMLEEQAAAIKAELAASGEQEIVGSMFRAQIVVSERRALDQKQAKVLIEAAGFEVPMTSTFVQSVRTSSIG